jgi:hypothetical protein
LASTESFYILKIIRKNRNVIRVNDPTFAYV